MSDVTGLVVYNEGYGRENPKIFKILPSGTQKPKSVNTTLGSLPLLVGLLLNSYCPNH